jgi:hypothetical protein
LGQSAGSKRGRRCKGVSLSIWKKGHGCADYSQDCLPAPAIGERSTMQLVSPFETTLHEEVLSMSSNQV